MRQRFVPFIEQLVGESEGSSQTLIAVGHGGLYRCMLPLVLSNVDQLFALDHALGHTEAIIAAHLEMRRYDCRSRTWRHEGRGPGVNCKSWACIL